MAARKKLEALRTFFGFAVERGWMKDNYAKKVKLPTVVDAPVMPFTTEQMDAILKAISIYRTRRMRSD